MIRKWIRLSPFPLLHQPGKEIQKGNLRRKKTNGKSLITATDREKRANGHLMQGNNATFDTNADLRFLLSDSW